MATNPPVPATPLDVEACVRLLDDLILMLAPHDAQSIADANQLRALASALPGMGKDSERLDALESWTKGDQTICPPGNHGGENTHWLLARDDDAKGDRYGIWSETTEGPTLREAIDAARAAPPQETSADAECRRSRRRRPCLGTNGRLCLLEPGHDGPHKPRPPEPDYGSDL